jgi:hypothetical protein
MPSFPVEDFMAVQLRQLESQQESRRSMSNNASAIGHLCARYIVYKRTVGDQALPPSPELQAIFNEGNDQEPRAVSLIRSMGFDFERQQQAIAFPEYEIRGFIDGVTVLKERNRNVAEWASEIKSVAAYYYPNLNNYRDLKNSEDNLFSKWYTQTQLAIYSISGDDPNACGVLWLKNKECSMVKPINIPIDFECIDRTFKRAKLINLHIKNNTLPERIDWYKGICRRCECRMICQPEEAFMAIEKTEDPAFIDKLKRREQLQQAGKEFKEIDKEVKDSLRYKSELLAPPFKITGKPHGSNGWRVFIDRFMDDESAEAVRVFTSIEDEPDTIKEVEMDEPTRLLTIAIKACKNMNDILKVKDRIKSTYDNPGNEMKKILQDCFKEQVRKIRKGQGE